MSNARVLTQKVHAARNVENTEITEIASLSKLMRDIASQLYSFQSHVEDRDIWSMQTHEIDCLCNVSCHAANFMALIQQCCFQKVGKHYVIIDNQDFHHSPCGTDALLR